MSRGEVLSQHQQLILDGFSQEYGRETIVADGRKAAAYDQAVAGLRERISGDFELEIDDPSTYYALMVGLVVGTTHVERVTEKGSPVSEAAKVTRIALAGLRPEDQSY